MKKVVILTVLIGLAPSAFAGESVGLIVNFEESIKNISLNQGITKSTRDGVTRSLQSMKSYIEHSDSKLLEKFLPIENATNVLCNTTQIIFNGYVVTLKEEENLIAPEITMGIVGPKAIQDIEKIIQPLRVDLKKVKGSIFSGFSLGKKSETQKLIDAAKSALIKKIEEVLKEFDVIKKTRRIKRDIK